MASLSEPITLRCLAGGYPKPFVTWWREKDRLPLISDRFEINRDHSLIYRAVQLYDLGPYTCHAYNSIGKPVSIEVTLMARGPANVRREEDRKYLKYVISPPEVSSTTTPRPRIIPSVVVTSPPEEEENSKFVLVIGFACLL